MRKSVHDQLLEMERNERIARDVRWSEARVVIATKKLKELSVILAQERQDAAVCLILDAIEILEGGK